jgi:hypothetical protein
VGYIVLTIEILAGFELALVPSHGDLGVLACHHRQKHSNPRGESVTDIYLFFALGSNAPKGLTRLCRDIENQSICGSR